MSHSLTSRALVDVAALRRPRASAPRARVDRSTNARYDTGVGCFGSKAGMTQMFTDDGLCVPVTVIGVRDMNYVTMVREAMAIESRE